MILDLDKKTNEPFDIYPQIHSCTTTDYRSKIRGPEAVYINLDFARILRFGVCFHFLGLKLRRDHGCARLYTHRYIHVLLPPAILKSVELKLYI